MITFFFFLIYIRLFLVGIYLLFSKREKKFVIPSARPYIFMLSFMLLLSNASLIVVNLASSLI